MDAAVVTEAAEAPRIVSVDQLASGEIPAAGYGGARRNLLQSTVNVTSGRRPSVGDTVGGASVKLVVATAPDAPVALTLYVARTSSAAGTGR